MTNFEMLCEGLKEIAHNHGFHAEVEEEDGLCIWGGCNVPTYMDVQMLLSDVGMSRECMDETSCGIEIMPDAKWMDERAEQEYRCGLEMWRRKI